MCWFLVLGLSCVLECARGSNESWDFSRNVTATLDNLLLSSNYDKKLRPDFGGPPTHVGVNMVIKSLGPVEENEERFYMDAYFRQIWYDRRLKFNIPGFQEFSMSWLFLDKIWKPDTYFMNGKKSYLHKITSPNKFVRVRNDGQLVYSMRLTLSARCKMHLRKFPLDSQKCPVVIGSYGYTSSDVLYSWTESSVGLEPGVEMAQYDVVNITTTNNVFVKRGKDEYSAVKASFHLKRAIGYYVLQIYVPCSLIVGASWISFWITPSDVAGRTSLAVTTVLSITTLGFGGRSQLPKVSHATALDWFVIICFAFAFAVMVEYAVINFFDKLRADIKKLLEARRKSLADKKEAAELAANSQTFEEIPLVTEKPKYVFLPNRWYSIPTNLNTADLRVDEFPAMGRETPKSDTGTLRHVLDAPMRFWRGLHFLPTQMDLESEQRFTRIDIVARRAFPLAFFSIITTYSLLYTFYITDEVPHEEGDVLLEF